MRNHRVPRACWALALTLGLTATAARAQDSAAAYLGGQTDVTIDMARQMRGGCDSCQKSRFWGRWLDKGGHQDQDCGCWANVNSMGCGSLHSECAFIFGSCRTFYGEPCFKQRPAPLPPVPPYPDYGFGFGPTGVRYPDYGNVHAPVPVRFP